MFSFSFFLLFLLLILTSSLSFPSPSFSLAEFSRISSVIYCFILPILFVFLSSSSSFILCLLFFYSFSLVLYSSHYFSLLLSPLLNFLAFSSLCIVLSFPFLSFLSLIPLTPSFCISFFLLLFPLSLFLLHFLTFLSFFLYLISSQFLPNLLFSPSPFYHFRLLSSNSFIHRLLFHPPFPPLSLSLLPFFTFLSFFLLFY